MAKILQIVQLVLGLGLIILVLLQQRGGGLSPLFGGSSQFYGTRRGLERTIFITTIIISVLFILSAVAVFILK